ncbi:hypothetical protein BGX21_005629 [Mortierella sp. AD011]|nr:hypothetical protein BGX21_005629 [Mortierella sp. AD011]
MSDNQFQPYPAQAGPDSETQRYPYHHKPKHSKYHKHHHHSKSKSGHHKPSKTVSSRCPKPTKTPSRYPEPTKRPPRPPLTPRPTVTNPTDPTITSTPIGTSSIPSVTNPSFTNPSQSQSRSQPQPSTSSETDVPTASSPAVSPTTASPYRRKNVAEQVYTDSDLVDGTPRGMEEGPRTAFRHESFMALVRDAAKGFYAPPLNADPHAVALGYPDPYAGPSAFIGPTIYAAPRGAYTTVANGENNHSIQGGRYSDGSDGSLQYLDVGTANARPHLQPSNNGH